MNGVMVTCRSEKIQVTLLDKKRRILGSWRLGSPVPAWLTELDTEQQALIHLTMASLRCCRDDPVDDAKLLIHAAEHIRRIREVLCSKVMRQPLNTERLESIWRELEMTVAVMRDITDRESRLGTVVLLDEEDPSLEQKIAKETSIGFG